MDVDVDVDVDADISQYNLVKRGFCAFEEKATEDMAKSLNEEWVKQVTAHFVGAVIPARGIRKKLVSNYYKTLVDRMDTDHNGRLSINEVLQAMTYPELDIQDIAARLVIKHDSEWYGGSQHQKWEKVLKNCDSLRVKYANKWLDSMEWMGHVPLFDKGEPIWHMHPVMFLDALKEENVCDCELLYADKFKITRYGTQYGPVFSGSISLGEYSRWDELLSKGKITKDEKYILIAMPQNEGNMDAIQSYGSEVITAGAMQKTVKNGTGFNGKGELSTQIASFRDAHPNLYITHAVNCGWTVEGSGSSSVIYYSNNVLTNGKKITAAELKTLLRRDCDQSTFGKFIHNKPLAALVKLISLPEYLDFQIIDFIDRLHRAENSPIGNGYKIKDYTKSDFGRALILDESVNRPAYVVPDFIKAIEIFHSKNPSVNTNPKTWGVQHNENESKLLEEYSLTRQMTDSTKRFNQLRAKL